VAKLVEVLPSYIANALAQVLPKRKVSAGGAFIHQKPLAHFVDKPSKHDPELGDLLIVCREKRSSGLVYNSMLLQAKISANPFCERIPKDHQYILYSEWPEFEYKRAGSLNGKKRSILPKTITQGAQYLLIKKNNPRELFTATVDRPLNGSRLLAVTLSSILSYDDGHTFQITRPRDDWSQMILDLLRLSASSLFNRRRGGYRDARRWSGDKAFNFLLSSGAQDLDLSQHNMKGDDAGGISIVCVDLGDASAEG